MTKKEFDKILKEEGNRMMAPQDDAANYSDRAFAERLLHDPKNMTVWRIFRPEQEESIFTNGYSSEYFGCGEGEYHGSGLYIFYDTRGVMGRLGTNEGKLGSKVMKCVLLNGFEDFIIFDRALAMKYYGSDDFRVQVNHLYTDEGLKKEILNVYKRTVHTHDYTIPSTSAEYTGYLSKALYAYFKESRTYNNGLRGGKTRGVVYNGANDHFAAVVFNPRDVIPIAVTNDRRLGNNHDFTHWYFKFSKKLWDNTQKLKDFASYGEKLKAMKLIKDYAKMPSQNDCLAVVLPNGRKSMYNIIDDAFISKYGFDKCFGWENYHTQSGNDIQVLPVEIGKKTFYLRKGNKGNDYYFFKKKSEPMPYMSLSEYDRVGIRGNDASLLSEGHGKFLNMYGNGNYLNVYHRTEPKHMKAIFAKGFTQEFTGLNANVAGPGIYCTFTPKESTYATKYFGDCMIECKLRDGLNGFLIPEGATINGKTYNTPLIKQLAYLTDPQFREEMVRKYTPLCKYNSAVSLYEALLKTKDLYKTDVR